MWASYTALTLFWSYNHSSPLQDLLFFLSALLALDVRVLDGQAPDVKIITYGDNYIDNEAAINAHRSTQHGEHEGNLVNTITKCAGPAKSNILLQEGTKGIENAPGKGQTKNIVVGESQLDKMGSNHLAHAVSVNDTGKHDEGNQMVVQNGGLQVKVSSHHSPDAEKGAEAKKSATRAVATGASSADNVARGLKGIEDEDDAALDEVPLTEGHVVDPRRQAECGWNTNEVEHALLPEVSAAHVAGQSVDADENEDTFDGAVDNAESKGLCVVFLPGLDVECEGSCFKYVSSNLV